MIDRPIRIGTRGSALALAQARLVAEALASLGTPHELVVIETDGDRRPPDTQWGEGAFVAAIEAGLLAGQVDVAVHSAKDVPTEEDHRLAIAAFLPRADPCDALVVAASSACTGLDMLPPGSRVGTDSPRRAGFLRAIRPDLVIEPLHGNVDTRLQRLDGGEVDALVLAVAGLERLGRSDRITERLSSDSVPPAPGQGAIAIQVRVADQATRVAVSALDDRPTRIAVEAERAFLRAAGGGCRAPIGALATVDDDRVRLLGGFVADDGRTVFDVVAAPADSFPAPAQRLAVALSERLAGRPPAGPELLRVVITRPVGQAAPLAARLGREGLVPMVVPAIAIEPAQPGADLDVALGRLESFDWAVVTSPNGARSVVAAAQRLGVDLATARWAAVGAATAAALEDVGVPDVWQPRTTSAAAVGAGLPVGRGARVLLVRGTLAARRLPDELRRRGVEVVDVVGYRTVEAPPASASLFEQAFDGPPPAAVLFASASAVRGLLTLAGPARREAVLGVPAVCIGPETAKEAGAAGFVLLGESLVQSTDAVATLTGRLVRAASPGAQP